MYKVIPPAGDAVAVPRLVFAKLTQPDAGEARFRVALYLLERGEATAEEAAGALHLKAEEARRALAFWEGAGLLRLDQPEVQAPVPVTAAPAKLTPGEMRELAGTDPAVGALVQEVQRILGGILNHNQSCLLAGLYARQGFPPDLIMMAAQQCAAEKKYKVYDVERKLAAWRREGIADCDDADRYLKCLAQREQNEGKVAETLGQQAAAFTLPERRRIAQWFEVFHYGPDMLEAARLAAGEKQDDVKYLHKILERWHTKGYKSPKEVAQAQGGGNLRVQKAKPTAGEDVLQKEAYVPMKFK